MHYIVLSIHDYLLAMKMNIHNNNITTCSITENRKKQYLVTEIKLNPSFF